MYKIEVDIISTQAAKRLFAFIQYTTVTAVTPAGISGSDSFQRRSRYTKFGGNKEFRAVKALNRLTNYLF